MTSKRSQRITDTTPFLLRRRDWVYLLSLLIPFMVYALVLKALLIFSMPSDPVSVDGLELMRIRLPTARVPGVLDILGLIQSDLLFNLAYIVLWTGVFATARGGVIRRIAVGLLHGLTLCLAVLITSAYQYFKVTGSTLDFATVRRGLTVVEEVRGLIASEVSIRLLLVTVALVMYTLLGPVWITSMVDRWHGCHNPNHVDATAQSHHCLRGFLLGLLAVACFAGSVLPGVGVSGVSKAFARDAAVNVAMTALEMAPSEELGKLETDILPAEQLPSEVRLLPTGATKRRNIVLIVLESTRADAVTPYNRTLRTTTFMDEFAQSSLLVDNAYAIIPHTHQALTALNCGIDPPLTLFGNRVLQIPGALPPICLPHLLRAQGYRTVYFMSQTKTFENSQQILTNLGYEDFYAVDDMKTEGFEPTNYFGYEDEVMLEPSRAWHEAHRGSPFLATYLTSAPHHDYLAPQKRHGRVAFTPNDLVNRYLNCVRNQDFFLKSLIDQYRQLGLYDDTVFIVLGDHGQAFGEHGSYGHDHTIYEEALRIPLLIHDPQQFRSGAHLEGPVTQLDILPTVTDLLGYKLEGGPYSGSSILRRLPDRRILRFSCLGETSCLALLQGKEKFIYHFDDRPEELFDLSSDPGERINLAGERSPDELKKWRAELLAWHTNVQSMYVARCTLVQGVACSPR